MTRPLSNTVATRITAVAIVAALVEVVRRRIAKATAANTELAARAAAREVSRG